MAASAKHYLMATTALVGLGLSILPAATSAEGLLTNEGDLAGPLAFETVTVSSHGMTGFVDGLQFAAPMTGHPNAGKETVLNAETTPVLSAAAAAPAAIIDSNAKQPSVLHAQALPDPAPTYPARQSEITTQTKLEATPEANLEITPDDTNPVEVAVVAQDSAPVISSGMPETSKNPDSKNIAARRVSSAELLPELPANSAEIEAHNRAFRERVARAVESNPALAGTKNRSDEFAEGVNEVRGGLYPQVGMRLSGGRSLAAPSGSYGSSAHGRTDLVLTARQLVYDFGATFARIDAARFEERATRFEGFDLANQMALDAISAYLNVINLRQQVILADQNVAQHRDISAMVETRITAKVAPLSDMDQINSRRATAEAQLITYTGQLERAEAVFRELFDEDAGSILAPVLDLTLPPNDEESLIAAVAEHPQMKMREMQVRAAKHLSEAARDDNLPKVVLEADATRYDIDPTSSSGGNNFGTPYGAVARLNIIYDFFDGGSGTARKKKAVYRAAKAANDRDAYQRELSRQIRYAYANAVATKRSLTALRLSVEAGKGTVNAYGQKYRIGRVSLIDLLDAQADLYKAVINFNSGRWEALLAQFNVLMLTGDLLDYFHVAVDKPLDAKVSSAPSIKEKLTGGLLDYFNIDVTKFLEFSTQDAPDIQE